MPTMDDILDQQILEAYRALEAIIWHTYTTYYPYKSW
jgi:hypothetical protein